MQNSLRLSDQRNRSVRAVTLALAVGAALVLFTGAPLAQLPLVLQIAHRRAPDRGLYQFFDSTSLRAALSSARSATSRFRRRFSSSSALSFWASPTSRPPC